MDKKYSTKKHLPLKISSEDSWEEYNQKQVRRYYNTNSNWKQKMQTLPDEEKQRLFFKYALEGNKKMVKFLFENGKVDLDAVDADGNTPLMFAVKSGKREVAEYLLKKGAKVDYIDNFGVSPLHLATRKNSLELVTLFLEYGANINICDNYNQTPIFDAVMENNPKMIELLFENGAKISYQNREGRTPLMVSSYNKFRQEAMCTLLKLGADVNVVDKMGRDAFMHAINNNNGAMMDILLKAGAVINRKDMAGFTPLMICAKRGNREGVRVLISRGADVFVRNAKMQSAFDIARACDNKTCAEIIAKAEKIYNSQMTDAQKIQELKKFATHNRVCNSCQK